MTAISSAPSIDPSVVGIDDFSEVALSLANDAVDGRGFCRDVTYISVAVEEYSSHRWALYELVHLAAISIAERGVELPSNTVLVDQGHGYHPDPSRGGVARLLI
ncbi:hypothetical protein [Rhodoglobus aureus]|uniref:Uncharacterized protein n=1 Tax=Rhodoglobus aureus TaxID=191497 RepID=A0ABN1VLZ4_9MICO